MNLQITYQYPHNNWTVFNVFKKFHELINEDIGNIEYLMTNTLYDGNPSGIYSPHIMTIRNLHSKKYHIVSYWDRACELDYVNNGWDINNRISIYTSSGTDLNFKYVPFSYLTYSLDFEFLAINSKPVTEKKNKKLMFRGFLYGDRLELKKLNLFEISDIKLNYFDYFNELNENKINLSLNGAAEICNRDIEILSSRSVLFRPKLIQKFHNELIPNYHYISFEYNQDSKIQAEIILDKYNEIKDDEDLLYFISENGYNWYKENGTVYSNVRILKNILDLEKLK